MQLPRRSRRWVLLGRIIAIIVLIGLVAYMVMAGLSTASMVGGAVAGVVALAALLSPYLFPPPSPVEAPHESAPDQVEDSGVAIATAGGTAITGAQISGDLGSLQVRRSGDARAEGSGSVAISGIQRRTAEDRDC